MAARVPRLVILAGLGLAIVVAYAAMLPPHPYPLSLPPDLDATASGQVRGVFHVHTTRSDGGGSVEAIAAAAREAGLQFVVFTDHGDGTREPDPPTYRSGVLCLDGVEISADGGHYIAVGLDGATPYPLGGDAAGVVEDVRRFGGFGVVAHPTSPKRALAWADPDLDVDGFEWLNGDSQWRDDSWLGLSAAAASYLTRPAGALASLLDRPDDALAWWDDFPGRRRVGVVGADAHARLALTRGGDGEGYDDALDVAFPGYEQVFRTFSLRVELDRPWSGDAHMDAAALLDGLREGRTYTAIDALATPAAFRFVGILAGGREVPMGSRVGSREGDVGLEAATSGGLPRDTRLTLLRNGQVVAETGDRHLQHVASRPGTYRIEVTLPPKRGARPVPWIVSNPIYVGLDAPRAVGLERSRPSRHHSLAPLSPEGRLRWVGESAPSTRARLAAVGEAVRFSYALGPEASRGAYAAAVYPLDGVRPGLATFDRIAFTARADRPHRVSIQLRAGRLEGEPRWRGSRYIGTSPAQVVVPFSDFVAVEPDRPGGSQLFLADVDAILIVIDLTNSTPQAAGILTLENVRLEGG